MLNRFSRRTPETSEKWIRSCSSGDHRATHICQNNPHLKRCFDQAHLENSTLEQFVSHLEGKLELKGLEAPDELQINTVTQQTTQQNPEKPKSTWHHCKKLGHYQTQCHQLKREKDQVQNNTNSSGNNNKNNNGGPTISNSKNKTPHNTNSNKTNNRNDRKLRPVYPPCETCAKTKYSTKRSYFGGNAADRPPPWNRRLDRQNQVQQKQAQNNSDVNYRAAAQTLNEKCHVFPPELRMADRRQLKQQNFNYSQGCLAATPRGIYRSIELK